MLAPVGHAGETRNSRLPLKLVCLLTLCFGLAEAGSAQESNSAQTERVIVTATDTSSPETTTLSIALGEGDRLTDSISQRAANFIMRDAGASSFNDVYSVRGLANTPNFSKQAVVLYVDDVPSSSTFTNFTDLLNPSAIELLRGPQGDGFGRNAEAGIIDIQTPLADNTTRLFSGVTVGDYDLRRFNATASGAAIKDKVFLKLDLLAEHRDGYLHNTVLDTRPDYENHVAGRLVARFVPTEEWEVTASVEVHNNRDGVQRYVPLTGELFQVGFDFDGRTRIQGDTEAIRVSRIVGDARLTAITSRKDWRLSPYEADFDFSPDPIVRGRFQLRQTQLAEEIRLEPALHDKDWDWRAGFFLGRVSTGGDELYALPGFAKRIVFDDLERNAAIFGRLSRRFGAFEVTRGMRLDYTNNEIERKRDESFSAPTAFTTGRAEWNVQPKLALQYHCSDDAAIYLQSSYGYRNGGFSFLETNPSLAEYDTERVLANEIGFQTAFARKRVNLRGALFYNQVWDYQVERLSIPPDVTVMNAPRVSLWGAELEAVAKPIEELELRAAFGYTHSDFNRFRDPISGEDYAGNKVPFSPEFTLALSAAYYHRLGPFAVVEALGTGETFYDEANTPFLREAAHAELNLKLGYKGKGFRVYAWCENPTDTRYFSQKIGYAAIGTPGAPRTIGATIAIEL
jgi:iron complex outermembrane receptor protein